MRMHVHFEKFGWDKLLVFITKSVELVATGLSVLDVAR